MKESLRKTNMMFYLSFESADYCRSVWKGKASEIIDSFIRLNMLETPEKKEEYKEVINREEQLIIELSQTRLKKQTLESEVKLKQQELNKQQAEEKKRQEVEKNRMSDTLRKSGIMRKL